MARDWRVALPILHGTGFTMREVMSSDAPWLFECLTASAVTRFITAPPASLESFERFIRWAREQRRAGLFACFAVVPEATGTPVGVFQIYRNHASSDTAEWGFAFGVRAWGSGLFSSGAPSVIDFAFQQMGLQRLEARAAVANGRGNGALLKMGAVREGVVKNGLVRDGEVLDQNLWSILNRDWYRSKAVWGPKVAA